jgi:hypothetical protein
MAAGLAPVVDDVAQAWQWTTAAGTEASARRSGFHVPEPESADLDFIDRQAELKEIRDGLSSSIGPHFWLLVAPPGLGKSSLLTFMEREFEAQGPAWEARLVDVRDLADPLADEPTSLLAEFFRQELGDKELGDVAESGIAERVARAIAADGRTFICLLDSAELLNEQVVAAVRKYFSEIYKRTGGWAGDDGAGRVALIVASRLDLGWKSVAPAPRFQLLPLTAFTKDDIGEALRKLASRARKDLGRTQHEQAVARLGGLSAGVPELLTSCLRWIQDKHWHQLDLLADDGMFREFGCSFVEDRLLAPASLLPPGLSDQVLKRSRVVQEALRIVAPYRIFTQSHLRQHLEPGSWLRHGLASAGWSLDDLWNALTRSALLGRPQDQPWQIIQPAIRTLLFRYFYETDDLRVAVQLQALDFDRFWSQGQTGSDQVVGLAECIWHEASALSMSNPRWLESGLIESASALTATLRPAENYSVDDLRQLLAAKLRNDPDLPDLLSGATGALDKLVHVVTSA